MQVFRSRHRRAFFRPAADQAANFTVQLHLGHLCRRQRVQRREHGAMVVLAVRDGEGNGDLPNPREGFAAENRLIFHRSSPPNSWRTRRLGSAVLLMTLMSLVWVVFMFGPFLS